MPPPPPASPHTLERLTRVARPGSQIFLLSDFRALDNSFERHLRQLARHSDVSMVHFFRSGGAQSAAPGALPGAGRQPFGRHRHRRRRAAPRLPGPVPGKAREACETGALPRCPTPGMRYRDGPAEGLERTFRRQDESGIGPDTAPVAGYPPSRGRRLVASRLRLVDTRGGAAPGRGGLGAPLSRRLAPPGRLGRIAGGAGDLAAWRGSRAVRATLLPRR